MTGNKMNTPMVRKEMTILADALERGYVDPCLAAGKLRDLTKHLTRKDQGKSRTVKEVEGNVGTV